MSIYDGLIRQQADTTMTRIWAEVFGLDRDREDPALEDEVHTLLYALRSQVDFVRLRLSAHRVPLELTRPGFERLREVASPSQSHQKWFSLRGNIQPPECRQAFTWAEWVLQDEDEAEMPADEMDDLRSELRALEEALRVTQMPPYLREFIQRQVEAIDAALRVYGVQGGRPLKDALRSVIGDMKIEEQSLVKEAAEQPDTVKDVLRRTGGIIEKTGKFCDSLNKIREFGGSVWSLGTAVGPLLPFFK